MSEAKGLSSSEFKDMLSLLKRHIEADMDQWELWELSTSRGDIHINISFGKEDSEHMYTNMDHLLQNL